MKLYELMDRTEFQSEFKICYYDYEKEKRIYITEKEGHEMQIRYIYEEEHIIHIEVEKEEG